jgi:hypothetical protein
VKSAQDSACIRMRVSFSSADERGGACNESPHEHGQRDQAHPGDVVYVHGVIADEGHHDAVSDLLDRTAHHLCGTHGSGANERCEVGIVVIEKAQRTMCACFTRQRPEPRSSQPWLFACALNLSADSSTLLCLPLEGLQTSYYENNTWVKKRSLHWQIFTTI